VGDPDGHLFKLNLESGGAPVVYDNKSSPGERAFTDAFEAWKQ
jgi:hypothetical protein